MAQRYRKAADTFVAMMDDGSQRFVTKGETLPENHELFRQMMRRDPEGAAAMWRVLDPDAEEPSKSEPAKAEAKAPVKPAPAKAEVPKVTRAAGKAQ